MYILEFHNLLDNHEMDVAMEDHRAFLKKYSASGVFLFSGQKVPRDGGIIVVNDISREKLDAILAEAPFIRNGTATCSVTTFLPKVLAPTVVAALHTL